MPHISTDQSRVKTHSYIKGQFVRQGKGQEIIKVEFVWLVDRDEIYVY